MTIPSSISGCLFGLALGDSLGAAVEFLRIDEIWDEYGDSGITELHEWRGLPAGSYTDDTQMSLATAKACVEAGNRLHTNDPVELTAIFHRHYIEWLFALEDPQNWRAPGRTCITALKSGQIGTPTHPLNSSKGCGGVMRAAPIGLVTSPERAFDLGVRSSAITHGHPSGYYSSGAQAELIAHLLRGATLEDAVHRVRESLVQHSCTEETVAAIDNAVHTAGTAVTDVAGIQQLGEGWVGEEALAIALFCALRHARDWKSAVIAAVNHSGDSDSTGSICGAILGTALGIDAIPREWVDVVENRDEIDALAQRMTAIVAADWG
jgi:ADP-ribosylglycohydrolase